MKLRIYDPVAAATLYTFNDAAYKGYVTGKVEGLGPPAIRLSRGSYAGRSGGYSGHRLWEPRLITISGMLLADTAAEMADRRAYWSEVMARLEDFHLLIDHDDGTQYLIFVGMDGMPQLDYIPLDRQRAPFSISMLADDPVIYNNTSGGSISVSLQKAVGGGVTWPLTWPLTWAAGVGATTVNNGGSVPIRPVITLTGSMTNPRVLNRTTGEFIELVGLTAPTGSVVVIDLANETVTLNGGNITGLVSSASSWWALETGQSTIVLSSSDAGDTVSGLMKWRNGVMGI